MCSYALFEYNVLVCVWSDGCGVRVTEPMDETPIAPQPYRDMDTQRIARETQMKLDKVIGRRQLRGNDIIQSFKGQEIREMIHSDDPSKHTTVVLTARSRKTIARDIMALSKLSGKVREQPFQFQLAVSIL